MVNVACIGVGTVGLSWAVVFAKAGHRVRLFDAMGDAFLDDSKLQARATLLGFEQAGLLTENIDNILARISVAESIGDAVHDADYVQESVREDIEVKRTVVAEITLHCSAYCILGSSTSAIQGSTFLGAIAKPNRALVVHPVNPPALIPLVEICGTPQTCEATIKWVTSFLADLEMKPIRVNKEIDGFILNRLQFTLVAEAMHLVGEGYCSVEDIDRVMTDGLALRWASLGPFEVAHLGAKQGFKGFVEHLGSMMKKIGQDAKTNYNWDSALVDKIHRDLEKNTPVSDIPARQHWRDARILATRSLQKQK